ncbi:uncharacterized protein Z518_11050 [Rhinocladiella mackenziei CBS 650.93]|uniref:C2H2-type domain-containing protein n=1 Tax=Rhinocladiella mackenziei CBS 650.93 TaxID=1442369 RepID=A0A0D2GMQ1_9EURO|nr:uncharacterized protein Z518_11050 [Rhinocladiella mackenziei CBS 650.93]KIW99637.1 hypothetical protein Z518_11050 [Rhinocladiella mackenziei CBS 650.93]
MGRTKPTENELWAQAQANGYQRGAHTEVDEVRNGEKYVDKTKIDHDRTLDRYILWQLKSMREDYERKGLPPPDEDAARSQYLGKKVPAPDLVTVKDFLRFYIATSRPRLDKDSEKPRPTADAICTVGEWFFAGFTRVTGTETNAEDRSEVYYWVRRTLVREGIVVNKHRPKHNFTIRDLTRVLLALWTYDDLIYIHERYRVQTTFLIHAFCFTGARIGAFFTDGLRYKDVELILQRDPGKKNGRDWRLVYIVHQRWVKNNRDPENITFGAAAKEHERLFYNDAGFLLAMAIADNALVGIDSLEDVRQQVIPAGKDEKPLRFKDSVLGLPILRKCTKGGRVTADPMPMNAFTAIFKSTLINSGYLWGLSIHAIRRQLGKGADRRNTAVERSQHLTQADPRVFGQSYVANCSSVDGQAAFRDEESDQRHIEYFQSLEKFHEDGLPDKLPAHLEEELKQDPRLRELETEVQILTGPQGSNQAFSAAKRELTKYQRTLKRDALRQYQESWVRERRDWYVLTRGNVVPQDNSKMELAQTIYKLFPERGRLAQAMASLYPLTTDKMWDALRDVQSLCLQDSDVLYLPGLRPVDGACPVKYCHRRMDSLPKAQRNQHIQTCVRQEMATRLGRLLSDIHYCYQCFDWVVGEKWEPHCQAHLDALTTKRCGTVTYCHTLVRPAYCPICIGKISLPASKRLKAWSRDHKLWIHISDDHLTSCQWPFTFSYPLCDTTHEDRASFQFYLMDTHKLSRSLPAKVINSSRQHSLEKEKIPLDEGVDEPGPWRKRKSPSSSSALKWTPPQSLDSTAATSEGRLPDRPPKRKRQKRQTPPPSTICPEVVVINDDVSDDNTAPITVDSVMLSPLSLSSIEDNNKYTDLEHDPFPRHYATPVETIHLLEPADCDGDSNLDTLFDQYLRSPSLSPPPLPPPSPPRLSDDDATSELSGATLIHAERDQSHSGAEIDTETLKSPVPEDVSKKEGARDEEDTCQIQNGPRIRLRVPRPQITLRLKVQGTCQAGKKKNIGAKGRREKKVNKRKEKKGPKSGKNKKGKRHSR